MREQEINDDAVGKVGAERLEGLKGGFFYALISIISHVPEGRTGKGKERKVP